MPMMTVEYRAVTGPNSAAEKISRFFVSEIPKSRDEPVAELEAYSTSGEPVIIKNYEAGRADGVIWLSRLDWEQEVVRLYKQWREQSRARSEPEPEPAPEPEPEAPPEEAEPDEPELDAEEILDAVEQAFRKLAKKHHPDQGGDPEAFKRIVAARDAAREYLEDN